MQCEFNYPEEQFPKGAVCCFQPDYFGGVTQNQGWDPAGSPRKQLPVLAPSEPSGQSSVFIWELISVPRLPGGTGTLYVCPRVLDKVFISSLQGDVLFTTVPGNL